MTLLEYVTLGKEIVTTLAAIIASIVAVSGLRAWKKQLKGKTEYELAQRMLRAVYKVRGTIDVVRHPFISAGETSLAIQEKNLEISFGEPDYDVLTSEAVYQKRWQGVDEAYRELGLAAMEAEAIWGEEARAILDPLRQCSSKLFASIMSHLRRLQRPYQGSFSESAIEQIEQVIYKRVGDPTNDRFNVELVEAIHQVENYLRPRLKL